jgi:hypothetical protein
MSHIDCAGKTVKLKSLPQSGCVIKQANVNQISTKEEMFMAKPKREKKAGLKEDNKGKREKTMEGVPDKGVEARNKAGKATTGEPNEGRKTMEGVPDKGL